MSSKAAEIISNIRVRINELSVDVNADVWYDASEFEADYPNDGYSVIQDSICSAPADLMAMIDELEKEIA